MFKLRKLTTMNLAEKKKKKQQLSNANKQKNANLPS